MICIARIVGDPSILQTVSFCLDEIASSLRSSQ
jgi:hypothetical protein